MRLTTLVTTTLVGLGLVLAGPAAARTTSASPGAAGLGDRLFPGLGNGGYDVARYNLDLLYLSEDPAQPLYGHVDITARATQSLSRFNLDFAGESVGAVWVDGVRAAWTRDGEELVITPPRAIRDGRRFSVQVRNFVSAPTVPDAEDPFSVAFFYSAEGSGTAPQPDGAHRIYPSNDHPRDKASFRFRIDAPAALTAVANGVLTGTRALPGRKVWKYEQRQPMATELTQLAVGRYTQIDRGGSDGVILRDLVPPASLADLEPKLALAREHLDFLRARVGRYPFDLYGSFVTNAPLGFALETQTLSVYDGTVFSEFPQGLWEGFMMHELTHEWFGNSVSPADWSDLWLNEGHATWYELVYAESKGYVQEDTGTEAATLAEYMRIVYAAQAQLRADFGPPGRPKSGAPAEFFNPNVYGGGALVLYALRNEIGVEAFERLQRRWVRENEGRSVTTADFTALASRVAGRDLTAFMDAWVYGESAPPVPGHPDWTIDPVPAPTRALLAHKPHGVGIRR